MKVYGIHGKAGSGKTTTAAYFRELGYEPKAFADPLYDGIEAMFGIDARNWSLHEKNQVIPWIGKSVRELLQLLGTEWGRCMVHPDIWVRTAHRRLEAIAAEREGATFVMSDVRMANEAEYVHAHGGKVIHIQRYNTPQVREHSSEDGISDRLIDKAISNNGTLRQLEEAIATYIRSLE